MDKETLLANNVCPNCWGKQEYDGRFVEAARDRQIDINNKDNTSTRAFIQNFMSKYVDGISLRKEGDRRICPACSARY
jgi:hypothetical protein